MKLDTYISGKVPVPKGDEAKSLTQEELGQGQEYHCLFNQGSPYTTSVIPTNTPKEMFDSLTKLF